MASARIKHVKALPEKGKMLLPFDNTNHAAVGKKLESIIEESGLPVNKGKGPDVYNYEVKTNKKYTKSATSMCRSTTNEIKNTPYDQSVFKSKLQQQGIVEYDEYTGVVTDSGSYDMSDNDTQHCLKDAYETIREKMHTITDEKYINGGDVIAERRKITHNSWQLRIPKKSMTKIKDHVRSKAIKDSIFEF